MGQVNLPLQGSLAPKRWYPNIIYNSTAATLTSTAATGTWKKVEKTRATCASTQRTKKIPGFSRTPSIPASPEPLGRKFL